MSQIFHFFFVVVFLCVTTNGQALSSSEKTEILDLHNQYRSLLAGGQYGGPASDMQQLVWSTSLESTAQTWADTCPTGHDRTQQNLAWGSSTTYSLSALVTSWWDEYKGVTYPSGVTGGYPIGSCSITACGHFTQMAWSGTTQVGCAAKRGGCSTWGTTLVCNYNAGNLDISGTSTQDYVFRPGSACSNCAATGTSSQSCVTNMNLCSNGGAAAGPLPTPQPTPNPVVASPVSCPSGSGYGLSFYYYPLKVSGATQADYEAALKSVKYGSCFTSISVTFSTYSSANDRVDASFLSSQTARDDFMNNLASRQDEMRSYVAGLHGAAAQTGNAPAPPQGGVTCTNGCPNESNSKDSTPDLGLILGLVFGICGVCCIAGVCVYYAMMKKKRDGDYQMMEQETYQPPTRT